MVGVLNAYTVPPNPTLGRFARVARALILLPLKEGTLTPSGVFLAPPNSRCVALTKHA